MKPSRKTVNFKFATQNLMYHQKTSVLAPCPQGSYQDAQESRAKHNKHDKHQANFRIH